LFGIDPRTLAVFRIAIGAVLLGDLAVRAGDLVEMYSDAGMFPRKVIARHVSSVWNWSFHFGGGSWEYQAVLFGIAAALGLALVLGFGTRLATVGSWLMLVSLHHRAPPILSGADILLRMLLFWSIWLPLGRVWSLDARSAKRGVAVDAGHEGAAVVVSIASAAILLQMAQMYLFTALFKSNAAWLGGQILAGALVHDFYASRSGSYFLQFPRALTGLTWGALALEWVAPLLMFIPRSTASLRIGCVGLLWALHVGILVLLEVDLFSWVALAGLLLFLPGRVWDGRFSRGWAPARTPDQAVAGSPRPSTGPRLPHRRVLDGVCLALLVFVVVQNLGGLPRSPLKGFTSAAWKPLTTGLGLGQKWNMFETVPIRSGWYVARAQLNDGSEVDLLRGGSAVDWSRPTFPAGIYPNHRWRKLFREMAFDDEMGYQVFRKPVAHFICMNWNARHPKEKQLAEFDLVYCMSKIPASGGMAGVRSTLRERFVSIDFRRASDSLPFVFGL
jgi:hypothetical protein